MLVRHFPSVSGRHCLDTFLGAPTYFWDVARTYDGNHIILAWCLTRNGFQAGAVWSRAVQSRVVGRKDAPIVPDTIPGTSTPRINVTGVLTNFWGFEHRHSA
eukprot:7569076-Pyramimonas_sp.AAC.1